MLKMSLIKFHWLLASQLGMDPQRFFGAMRGLPRFVRDWRQFRRRYHGRLVLKPCLHDRFAEGGVTNSEYFWQDLVVAQQIHDRRPAKHVDVGSRIDGFVAHLASFRDVEVFDVRPLTAQIPRVVFRQADVTSDAFLAAAGICDGYCDSLSCLHALEHFGLGRYGDPLDPLGFERGLANMAGLLVSGGIFYLSVPVGRQLVEFNANWVFDPRTIIDRAADYRLGLTALTVFCPREGLRRVATNEESLSELARSRYRLGIFEFIKGDVDRPTACSVEP